MDIDAVADELYGLLPEEFTATRTAREKEAKAAGDKKLAAQIHSLTKPNQVAWMVNLLVREHPEEVRPLIELGAGLREASGDLDPEQLREFSRQQHLLLRALVQQARRLASAAGRKVSETVVRSLEDTLRAALVDPDAAEAVLSGQLTGGLQHSGFGPAGGAGSGTASRAAARSSATAQTPIDEVAVARRAAADRELEAAELAAERAADTRNAAAKQAEQAAAQLTAAAAEVERLTAELDRAVAEHATREEEEEQQQGALREAEDGLTEADSRLAKARERRTSLDK